MKLPEILSIAKLVSDIESRHGVLVEAINEYQTKREEAAEKIASVTGESFADALKELPAVPRPRVERAPKPPNAPPVLEEAPPEDDDAPL
jgi:hypothetical protein